jgi:CRP-like cAMP-binding protein
MTTDRDALAALVTNLKTHAPLDRDDCEAITALPATRRTMEPLSYLVREGEPPPTHCSVLLGGFAFRQKLSGEGTRQILSVHLPGEALDFQLLFLDCADHNVQALTRVELANVPRAAIRQLMEERPGVARAVINKMLVEASISREWLLNVGRRDARTRLAHFLCEFALRVDLQGVKGNGGYELPMTQEQIGDALGLTSVHVNRTLRVLEGEGLLRRSGRKVVFPQWQELRRVADFSALYLHLANPPLALQPVY